MKTNRSPARLVEALARANRHWQTRRQAAPAPFTIALSREAGARGAEVARALGQRLDWPGYDRHRATSGPVKEASDGRGYCEQSGHFLAGDALPGVLPAGALF